MILDVARRTVVTAAEDDTLSDVAGLMEYYNVGCVVVVRQDKPLGVLTDRDLALRTLLRPKNGKKPATAADIMSTEIHTIREDQGFAHAIELMGQFGVRRLPVVDRAGKLRGLVTMDDLVEVLGKNQHGVAALAARQQKAPKKAAATEKKPQAAALDAGCVF
jgi:CBS domain-containing protein